MKVMYIDAQNVHKAIEYLWWTLDRWKFYTYAINKFWLDEIKIFQWYLTRYESFYTKLKWIWYKVIFKNSMILPNWAVKWNVDIDIAIESLVDYYEDDLEKAYLVSSDWDYNTLVDKFREKNILWRVLIPSRESASLLLKKAAWSNIQSIQDLKYLLEKEKP